MKDDGQAVMDSFQATIDTLLMVSGLSHNGGEALGAASIPDCTLVKALTKTQSYMSHPFPVKAHLILVHVTLLNTNTHISTKTKAVGHWPVSDSHVSHLPVSHMPIGHLRVSHEAVSHMPIGHLPVRHEAVSH